MAKAVEKLAFGALDSTLLGIIFYNVSPLFKEALTDTATLAKDCVGFVRKHGLYGTYNELREGYELVQDNRGLIEEVVDDALNSSMQIKEEVDEILAGFALK